MATTWTEVTGNAVTWTDATGNSVDWSPLEPMGYGQVPFGHPSDGEFRIHDKGFGSPTTKWKDA